MTKRQIVTAIVALLVFLLLTGVVVYSSLYSPKPPTASGPISATGAFADNKPNELIVKQTENLAAARKLTPYRSNDFSIEYVSSKIMFVVTLPNNDVATAETKLSTWLKSNGVDYSLIANYFRFIIN